MSADAESPCAECGGGCCSFWDMTISWRPLDEGQRYDSLMLDAGQDVIDDLLFTDGEVPDMRWYIIGNEGGERHLAHDCQHLTDDGRCGEYERRPGMCRRFECDALAGDVDFEEFADNRLFDGRRPESHVIKEVTDRVQGIITKRTADVRGGEQR